MASSHWSRDSLAVRLSLNFGMGTLLILGLLGIVLFVAFKEQVLSHDSNELASKTVAVQTLLNGINQPADIGESIKRIRATVFGHKGLDIGISIGSLWILKPGVTIVDHAQLNDVVPDTGLGDQTLVDIGEKRWAIYHLAHRMSERPNSVIRAMVVADITASNQLVEGLRNALIAIGLIGVAITAIVTRVATLRGLAPLRQAAQEAEQMTAQVLDHPLSVEDAPMEIRELVSSINQILSRQKKSFASLERFSADIAHELRTPVNALLVQIRGTLSRNQTISEYRDTLHMSLEELNHLKQIVADILFIARTDRGINTTSFEIADLTKTATEVVEFVEIIASEKDQTIAIEGELITHGDPLMLRRALSDLLTNAVRHAPRNTHILLTLTAGQGYAVIRVVSSHDDSLTQSDVERLLDRLDRQSTGQAGLQARPGPGLSIVQSIMRVHKGQATAGLEAGQLWVQLRWPFI